MLTPLYRFYANEFFDVEGIIRSSAISPHLNERAGDSM